MRSLGRAIPSPAMAVALTALFVALGGTGYAASHLQTSGGSSNAQTAKKKKPKPVSDAAEDKKQVEKLAPHLSVSFAKTAGSAATAGSATTAGSAATAGSATTAGSAASATNANHASSADSATTAGNGFKGFAEIATGGEMSNTSGFGGAVVDHLGAGAYCISGLSFTPVHVQVSLISPDAGLTIAAGIGKGPSSCPENTQVRVFTKTSGGTLTDPLSGFFILLI
jgi:hypothetical protein